LEDCGECRNAYGQLRQLQRATEELSFASPPEDRMQELERRLSVSAPRRVGWLLVVVGAIAWLVYAAWLFVVDPEIATFEKLLVGALVIGAFLLLWSVARQRWLELPRDRYRGVKR
jgi:uncharacterized membrane protein